MPSSAGEYATLLDAVDEQQERLFGPRPADIWTGQSAAQFRFDPHRELDPNLAVLASYIEPDDVVVDVGGGAGRLSLPLALQCREVLTVEPSAGMAAEYEGSRQEAGISNARLVPARWTDGHGIEGDVTLTCDVTYFVRDIVPFVEKMQSAARRRVIILVWSGAAAQPRVRPVSQILRRAAGSHARAPGTAAGALGPGHSAQSASAPRPDVVGRLALTVRGRRRWTR